MVLALLFILFPQNSHTFLFSAVPYLALQTLQLYGVLLAGLGLGYLLASLNPQNHAAVLLMGLLANLLFAAWLPTVAGQSFGLSLAGPFWVALALGWCAVLTAVLYQMAKARQAPQTLAQTYQEPLSKTLNRFRTHKGKNLLQLSNEQPSLVVFLKQFNSALSQETLADIQQQRTAIENRGAQLVLVHLTEEEEAEAEVQRWGLADVHLISDPSGIMYNAFGLERENHKQFYTWQQRLRELLAGLLDQNGQSALKGDVLKVPGVFLISKGEIVRSYRHQYSSERPDYRKLASSQAA